MDQFAEIRPGDRLPGLPTKPWNKMLGLLKPEAEGPTPPGQPDTSVEFLVKNTTAGTVPRGGVLKVDAPFYLHADNAALFFESDTLKGTTPAAAAPFVVPLEAIPPGGFGTCRALGYVKALVNVTDAAHTHAAPTTATDKLTSGASGPALIVHKPTGTGDKWCTVLLLGQSAAASTAARVTHTADQTLNATDYAVQFNAESAAAGDTAFDTGGFHDTATNNTRLTVPAAGAYVMGGAVHCNGQDSGGNSDPVGTFWGIYVRRNGTDVLAWGTRYTTVVLAEVVYLNVSTACWLEAGDYLELVINKPAGFQSKVLSVPAAATPKWAPVFWIAGQ